MMHSYLENCTDLYIWLKLVSCEQQAESDYKTGLKKDDAERFWSNFKLWFLNQKNKKKQFLFFCGS